jgi:hypothetical protein
MFTAVYERLETEEKRHWIIYVDESGLWGVATYKMRGNICVTEKRNQIYIIIIIIR